MGVQDCCCLGRGLGIIVSASAAAAAGRSTDGVELQEDAGSGQLLMCHESTWNNSMYHVASLLWDTSEELEEIHCRTWP